MIRSGIILVHLVEQFDPVAEVEMVGSLDDLELSRRSETFEEWSDTRVEIDEDVVTAGQDERFDRVCNWKLIGFESLAPNEGLGNRRQTAERAHSALECRDLERCPAAVGVA